MLRVAALAKIITDNWIGQEINKLAIVKACSLHDVAKPVAFDTSIENLKKYGQSPDEQTNAIKLKEFIKSNYGTDEHKAAISMCKDVGMDVQGLKILDNIEWHLIPNLIKINDLESLIAIYSDMRISPEGIMDISKRLENLKGRYTTDKRKHSVRKRNSKIIEPKIQESVKTDLNSVTNEALESLFPQILGLKIG